MTAPRITVCLVVGDEARDLHGCLQSARQLGHLLTGICVYAAGASESILSAARHAGAKVQIAHWDGDLSAARNAAACMTTAPWVLVLEPHERVRVDIPALTTLLSLPDRMVGEPDAMTVQVAGRHGGHGRREQRLYRPDRAHFTGALEARLEPLVPGRRLVTVGAGTEALSIWSVVAEPDAALERDRLERRLDRAYSAVAALEAGGVGGNDLVTALVERSRAHRALGDDNRALADLNRARRVKASDTYRWRAREDLTTLLIEHGYYDGANRLIAELRADGADEQYSDWLTAQLHSAQGQARVAWDILARLENATDSEGRVVATPQILAEQMHLANRLGEFDEALARCVDLIARYGLAARHGRMLFKLWGPRSLTGLADMIIQADARRLDEVADGFDTLPAPGPELAAALREVRTDTPKAVRIM